MSPTTDPAAANPRAAAEPASASPRGASGTPSPVRAPRPAGEGTSNSPRRERAAQGIPGPATGEADPAAGNRLPASPGRGRPETPAGASDNDSPPAGSRGLGGAEWRAAAKRAQSGHQPRRTAPRAAAKVTIPPAPATGAALTATANCLGRCDWTAGPGDPAGVDKAAERHTTKPPKHPTNTVSVVAEIGGAA